MPSTFSDFFTVHILNEENITKIFFLHSCDKAIKASSWQSWQRDSTVLHSLNASIFYTYLPKTSLDSRKSYASNKGKSHGVPNWQPLEGNRYKKWSQIWKSKTEVWHYIWLNVILQFLMLWRPVVLILSCFDSKVLMIGHIDEFFHFFQKVY